MRRFLLPAVLLSFPACSQKNPAQPDVLVVDTGSDTDVRVQDTGADVAPDVPRDAGTDVPGVDARDADTDVTDATDAADARDAGVDVPLGPPFCATGHDVTGARPPDGFCVRLYARATSPAVPLTPRVLTFAPNGDVFVASPSTPTPGGAPTGRGAILVLPDDDHDGVADSVLTYAGPPASADFESVHGLAFYGGSLYYTLSDGVYRVPYRTGDRAMPGTPAPVRIANLFGAGDRWTHTLAIARDGSIFTSRGQYNEGMCPAGNPRSGSVLLVGTGHDMLGDIIAQGLRNPMYLRCEPWGTCYGAELSGDGWDGIGGREKLIQFTSTNHDDYGFPCCVDRDRPVPGISPPHDCSHITVSVQTYTLHDTPFGFDWDKGNFPAPYTNGFFVAQHGVVGSWVHTGIYWAPTDPATHAPTRPVVPFVEGWSIAGPIRGRTTDLVFAPDGRMFFTDDQDGGIYWLAPRTLRMPAR